MGLEREKEGPPMQKARDLLRKVSVLAKIPKVFAKGNTKEIFPTTCGEYHLEVS